MEWVSVIILFSVGILLILGEVLIIPGTTVVGFLGFGMTVGGVSLAYYQHGTLVGSLFLIGGIVVSGGALWAAFKFDLWKRFALNETIDSKVNGKEPQHNIKKGDVGITLSALRPSGNAEFEGVEKEVTTYGPFVSSGVQIVVVKIEPYKIFVEELNSTT